VGVCYLIPWPVVLLFVKWNKGSKPMLLTSIERESILESVSCTHHMKDVSNAVGAPV
jgi:hypothetical protein